MPSFDIVSLADSVELGNSVTQTNKELQTRFDFKDSSAKLEINNLELIIYADNDFQLEQIRSILLNKLSKRTVDVRVLGDAKLDKISGGKLKQTITIRNGIPTDMAKAMIKFIKDLGLKTQASIQGDLIRVSGTKKDDLQLVMQKVKGHASIPVQFNNFRD
jgi:uncharacterized protein YajQ (UPF0234 family)